MADCGATGSALDRASRAVLGSVAQSGQGQQQQLAAKHVGALLGHASVAAGGTTSQGSMPSMPAFRPDHLNLPQQQQPQQQQQPPRVSSQQQPSMMMQQQPMDAVWQQQVPSMHATSAGPHHAMMHAAGNPAMLAQQNQMANFNMMMMMQQQQMMIMQQQAQQQQKQAATNTTKEALTSDRLQQQSSEVVDAIDQWHEGLVDDLVQGVNLDDGIAKGATIEQLAAAWAEAQTEDVSQGDPVQAAKGATIEELAAAWAEAQSDMYEEHHLETANAAGAQTSWWGDQGPAWDDDGVTVGPTPYQFLHKMESQQQQTTDWMDEGMRYFKEGKIHSAIKSFETELQLNDPDNATAWRMLGNCHAENDQDQEAIACLEQAVDRDPYSPEALLALGVSCVNELNNVKAIEYLRQWITHNPKYAGMNLALEEDMYGETDEAAEAVGTTTGFEDVQRLLLKALQFDSTDAADVWEALGVVYNVSRDYDAAINAFQMAIESRPDDYQLWNKLGATLANGNHPTKALPAYDKALQIKPRYARAWLNMAISHSSLEDYNEAARCYLQTLSLNPAAVHCWSYLRVALSCSEQWDLLPLVASQNLEAFQEHFDFVLHEIENLPK